MWSLLYLVVRALARLLVIAGQPGRADGSKDLEILVLRHQLRVLQRTSAPPKLRAIDRILLAPASRVIPRWGPKASFSAEAYEPWIVGQVTGIRVDQATIDQVIRALSAPKVLPLDANRARMERMKRELALDHAAGKIADETYLARHFCLGTRRPPRRPLHKPSWPSMGTPWD